MVGVEGKTETDQHICKLTQMAVVQYQVVCLLVSRPSQRQPDLVHGEKAIKLHRLSGPVCDAHGSCSDEQ